MGRPKTYGTYKRRRQQRERWAARYEREGDLYRWLPRPSWGTAVFLLGAVVSYFTFGSLGGFSLVFLILGAICGLLVGGVRMGLEEERREKSLAEAKKPPDRATRKSDKALIDRIAIVTATGTKEAAVLEEIIWPRLPELDYLTRTPQGRRQRLDEIDGFARGAKRALDELRRNDPLFAGSLEDSVARLHDAKEK